MIEDAVILKKPWFRRELHLSGRFYVLERSLEDGEKDLVDLCWKTKREGRWVFFEDRGLWVYIKGESSERVSENEFVISYKSPRIDFSSIGTLPIDYHTHPIRSVNLMYHQRRKVSGGLRRELTEIEERRLINTCFIKALFHSLRDVKSYHTQSAGEPRLRSRIASPLGVTELSINGNICDTGNVEDLTLEEYADEVWNLISGNRRESVVVDYNRRFGYVVTLNFRAFRNLPFKFTDALEV